MIALSPMETALKAVSDDWEYRSAEKVRFRYSRQRDQLLRNQREVELKLIQKRRAKLVALGLPGDLDALGMLDAALAIMENISGSGEFHIRVTTSSGVIW